jgi:hypothetical protein
MIDDMESSRRRRARRLSRHASEASRRSGDRGIEFPGTSVLVAAAAGRWLFVVSRSMTLASDPIRHRIIACRHVPSPLVTNCYAPHRARPIVDRRAWGAAREPGSHVMTGSMTGAAARQDAPPRMASEPAQKTTPHTLTWLARTFELAQRERIRRGERIRAIAQARDLSWDAPVAGMDAEELLARIERGETLGPVPFLGMLYQHAWAEERELSRLLEDAVTQHPAWPWLMQIRGVGPRLAARLLSRLRIELARSPASFWAYCGLATVQATEYRCATCGARTLAPSRGAVPSRHLGADRRACDGRFARVATPECQRVAQPKPRRLEARSYDASAKTICFLIGTSFSRQGGPYKLFYREAFERYTCRHPEWPAKRRVLAAMRLTVKLFLKHLWMVWREAEGLSSEFSATPSATGAPTPGPWDMVSPPSVEKKRAADRLAQKLGTRTVRRGRPPKLA